MKIEKSEEIIELAKALAKAQGEIENAGKNAKNPHFKSTYADLAELLNAVRPVFSANGLSVTQHPFQDGNTVTVETMLMHSSGQWIASGLSSPIAKSDAQGIGSAITYMRRYSLAAIAGIAQEDDDGNADCKPPNKPQNNEAINADQCLFILSEIEKREVAKDKILAFAGVKLFDEIPLSKFASIKTTLLSKPLKGVKNADN